MSTTQEQTPSTPPPSPDRAGNNRYVTISNGEMRYRPANGEKGPDGKVAKVAIDKIDGVFRRCQLRNSVINGKPVLQVEIEIEGREGETNIIQVSAQNSVGSCMAAAGVLGLRKDGWCSISAHPSKTMNDFGKYTTFVNFQSYDNEKWVDVKVAKSDWGDAPWKDLQDKVFEALEKHPAYKEVERKGGDGDEDGDGGGGFDMYCGMVDGLGWPSASNKDNHHAHLAYLTDLLGGKSVFGGEIASSFEAISDDQWNDVFETLKHMKAGNIPKIIKNLTL